jgi:hypothetical protein
MRALELLPSSFRLRRLGALALTTALAGLALEVALAHSGFAHRGQWVPLYAAGLSTLMITLGAWLPQARAFSALTGAAGLLDVTVGLLGLGFHAKPVIDELAGAELSVAALISALETAPPPLAPGGFAAIGLVLLMLSSSRVTLSVRLPSVLARGG